MQRIVADAKLPDILKETSMPVEIVDESGQLLGVFQPEPIDERAVYEWARTAFTDEELERAPAKYGVLHRRRKSSND